MVLRLKDVLKRLFGNISVNIIISHNIGVGVFGSYDDKHNKIIVCAPEYIPKNHYLVDPLWIKKYQNVTIMYYSIEAFIIGICIHECTHHMRKITCVWTSTAFYESKKAQNIEEWNCYQKEIDSVKELCLGKIYNSRRKYKLWTDGFGQVWSLIEIKG